MMDFEDSIDWGAFDVGDFKDYYLTEELFSKFSLKTTPDESKKPKAVKLDDKVEKKKDVTSNPESVPPFQRVSDLSIEDQKFFIKIYKNFVAGKDISSENITRLQNLVWLLQCEHEQFSNFLHSQSLLLKNDYNFVDPVVQELVQNYLMGKRKCVQDQQYNLIQTVSLPHGAVFPNDPILRYVSTLEKEVGQRLLDPPYLEHSEKLQVIGSFKDDGISCEMLDESSIRNLCTNHDANFILTDTALQTLIDNNQPSYDKEWELPVTVMDNVPGTIVINDPLPAKSVTPREMNTLYYKQHLLHMFGSTGDPDSENCDSEAEKVVKKVVKEDNLEEEMNDTTQKDKISTEPQGISTTTFGDSKLENVNRKKNSYTFSSWTFGDLKLLIRSRHDGVMYKSKEGGRGSLKPVNLFVKPEYQRSFGLEQITKSEASRMWIKTYIDDASLSICARVDPRTSELIRVDVLDQPTLINLSSFNPAQPMKMVHCVLTHLSKILKTGGYKLSHSLEDMHICVYEKETVNCVGKKTSEQHDNPAKQTDVLKPYEKVVPWVPIDPNIFLQQHITQDHLPMTFPAITSEELKKLIAKQQNVEKKNRKKNKKKKCSNAFRTNFKQTKPNTEISDKRLNKPVVFVSKDQPRNNCMSQRLRSAKPMTYDDDIDLDF